MCEIFPNPSNGNYYFQCGKDITPQSIEVFDLKGVPLKFNVHNNNIKIESPIMGLIMIVVNIENRSIVKRVIKNAR